MLARISARPIVFATIIVLVLGAAIGVVLQRGGHARPQILPAVFTADQHTVAESSAVAVPASMQAVSRLAAAGSPGAPESIGQLVRAPSQLIRTANLSIEVKEVSKALQTATRIADEQLGDVISLNDETPESPADGHSATMEVRVPQSRFGETLGLLGKLGTVTSQSTNAQDASDRIVDASARLRNLRRTERDMLGIMDRSGSIDQVLEVTQQLSSVREQIEQLDATLQNMKGQVAYSTIDIALSSPPIVTAPSVSRLLGSTWSAALASLRDFTVSLLSVGLWLVAFSPYIAVLALLGVLAARRLRLSH